MFRAHNKTLKKQDGSPLALMDTTWPQLFLHLCERPASVMCVISSRVENVIIPMLRVLGSLDRYIPTIKSKRKREKNTWTPRYLIIWYVKVSRDAPGKWFRNVSKEVAPSIPRIFFFFLSFLNNKKEWRRGDRHDTKGRLFNDRGRSSSDADPRRHKLRGGRAGPSPKREKTPVDKRLWSWYFHPAPKALHSITKSLVFLFFF